MDTAVSGTETVPPMRGRARQARANEFLGSMRRCRAKRLRYPHTPAPRPERRGGGGGGARPLLPPSLAPARAAQGLRAPRADSRDSRRARASARGVRARAAAGVSGSTRSSLRSPDISIRGSEGDMYCPIRLVTRCASVR